MATSVERLAPSGRLLDVAMLAGECGSELARDGIDSIFRLAPKLSWHLPAHCRFLSLLKRFFKAIKMAQLQERLLP
jgi:hypothetical protein